MARNSVNDPVHRVQLYVRRSGELLRSRGLLERPSYRHETLEGADLDRFLATGSEQVDRLAPEIEGLLARPLASARALDFGCGMGRTALPLAERCEHLYGVDISQPALQEADRHAQRLGLTNVEWVQTERLGELRGSYDIVFSMWVFQHIPSREGERLLETLIEGMRPGGVGVTHLNLRYAFNPLNLRRLLPRTYLMTNSYSLNRIGNTLAAHGVSEWTVRWHRSEAFPSATLLFKKPPAVAG